MDELEHLANAAKSRRRKVARPGAKQPIPQGVIIGCVIAVVAIIGVIVAMNWSSDEPAPETPAAAEVRKQAAAKPKEVAPQTDTGLKGRGLFEDPTPTRKPRP